jgi:hypothetical protein
MLLLGGSLIPRGYDGYNPQHCGTTAFILTEGLALPTAVYIYLLVHLCDLPLLPVLSVLQLLIVSYSVDRIPSGPFCHDSFSMIYYIQSSPLEP